MAESRRVLVTRPAVDAGPLAQALEARGFEVRMEPLLEIRFPDQPAPDLSGLQALAFTSANGVRALIHAAPEAAAVAGLSVFAVGRATARAAREVGFDEVISADGDVSSLARLIIGRLQKGKGGVLHVAGSHRAGDLVSRIEAAGIPATRAVLYEAAAVEALSEDAVEEIEAGAIGWVLIFSPRTAGLFVNLMDAAGLATKARAMCLVALSPAVAEAAAALPWGDVRVAVSPDQEALLEALAHAADDS